MPRHSIPAITLALGVLIGLLITSFVTEERNECIENAKFKDAIVSAGSTDLIFSMSAHQEIVIRIFHESSDQSLIDEFTSPGVDEPAGPKMEIIGKTFKLCNPGSAVVIQPMRK